LAITVNTLRKRATCAGVAILRLPGVVDITSEDLSQKLRDALLVGPLELEACDVTRVDAAGLQLLCAAALAARASGGIVWRNPSTALTVGARLLGLAPTLGL
jgi:anti-anti-sigma regulatory factor